MNIQTDKFTATEARAFAAKIKTECSECFKEVKSVKFWGSWVIKIDGGSETPYGRTIESVEDAEETIRIFKN